MTNKEWIDLLSKEVDVSRTSARDMLHAMMTIKRYDNFKRTFDPLPDKKRRASDERSDKQTGELRLLSRRQ